MLSLAKLGKFEHRRSVGGGGIDVALDLDTEMGFVGIVNVCSVCIDLVDIVDIDSQMSIIIVVDGMHNDDSVHVMSVGSVAGVGTIEYHGGSRMGSVGLPILHPHMPPVGHTNSGDACRAAKAYSPRTCST